MLRTISRRAAWGLIGWAALLQAQPRPTPELLTPAERATAVEAVQAAIREHYVDPELRQPIVERLAQAQRAGRYDTGDAGVLAERITDDLQAASHDTHLWLRVDPAAYAAALAAPRSEAGEEALWRRRALRRHHGLTELKLLPGNIRYLRIAEFAWVRDETGTVYDDAMRFLKGGDAVVIDLRGNGGGSHGAVQYLVSHFLDEDVLELTFLQGSQAPQQSRALGHLPAGRLQHKPLYVLVDGRTASAAEAFAYDVQQFKLGELVGARTAGAANNNRLLPVAPKFTLSVSHGRPVHAVSNANWEGAGIRPTVEAEPAQALDVAQALALKRLAAAADATPEAQAEYAWAQTGVEASLHPVTPSPVRLQLLAGRYGEVDVSWRGESLWLSLPRRPTARLLPLTADGLFAVEGNDMTRVRLTGRSLELQRRGEPTPRVFNRG